MDIWIVENIGYGRYRIKELDPGRMEVEVLAQWYAVTYPDVIVFFGTLDTELAEVDWGEIDSNARAYGWEIGNGQSLMEKIEFSPDNPFINPNWRDQVQTSNE